MTWMSGKAQLERRGSTTSELLSERLYSVNRQLSVYLIDSRAEKFSVREIEFLNSLLAEAIVELRKHDK